MRIAISCLCLLGMLAPGTTCFPLQQQTSVPTQRTTLGMTITTPTSDQTVGQGTVLQIRWIASNLTGQPAAAEVWVESRTDLSRTTLESGFEVDGTTSHTSTWNTSSAAAGLYVIYGGLATPDRTVDATAPGQITVNARPTFAFTQPTTDQTLANNATLTLAWTGSDPENAGQATIGLDPVNATPDPNHTSGDEMFIKDVTLSTDNVAASFDWNVTDLNGAMVPDGTYVLFALVGDDVNPDRPVDAGVQITIQTPGPSQQQGEG